MIAALLLATAFEFSGVLGQSASEGCPPVDFLGALCVAEDPAGRVWFHGGGRTLCRIEKEGDFTPFAVSPIAFNTLFPDGARLWANAGRELVAITVDAGGTPRAGDRVKLDLPFAKGAVRPESDGHPFAKVGKFFASDDKRGKIVCYDARGTRIGDFADVPSTGRPSPVCAMSFLPETGQLVAVTGFPDCRIYRFNPDGSRDDTCGWPIFRGYGFFQTAGGRLWHLNGAEMMEVRKGFSVATAERRNIGPAASTRGYAEDRRTGCRYVASYQGLCWAKPGEAGYPHRIGGIPRLETLMLDRGAVIFSAGIERVRQLWLDDAPDTPLSSVDTLQNQHSWTAALTAISPFGRDFISVTAKGGPELFVFWPDERTKNNRRKWHPFAFEPALPTEDCRAVTADFETREIFFSCGEKVLRSDYPMTDVPRPVLKVREAGVETGGEVLFLARPGASPFVAFATAAEVGVFRAVDGAVVWRKPVKGVSGLAAVDGMLAVSAADGLRLVSLADGAVQATLDQDRVPSGYEAGRVAAEGRWIVLEDRKARRLLRLVRSL